LPFACCRYACENPTTLAWLKGEAGYDGAVISDWGATHSTINAALVRANACWRA